MEKIRVRLHSISGKDLLHKLAASLICCLLCINISTAQSSCGACAHVDSVVTRTIQLPGFDKPKSLQLSARDGKLYFQGDIYVGKVGDSDLQKGVALDFGLWPNNTLVYEINPAFNIIEAGLINGAAAIITTSTNLNVIARTTETEYVEIINSESGCYSGIGISSDTINLGPGCLSTGTIIHELLHTAGIFHEQSREDRDTYISINLSNVHPDNQHNFNKVINGTTDYGPYNYFSIMHYGAYDFALNTNIPVITYPSGIPGPFGSTTLSAGDIATINKLYPLCNVNLDLNGESLNGRYTTTDYISTSNSVLDSTKFTILSAINKVELKTGTHLKSGSQARILLDGCSPPN